MQESAYSRVIIIKLPTGVRALATRHSYHSPSNINSDELFTEQYYALLESIALTPSADYLNTSAQQLIQFLNIRYVMVTEISAHKPHHTKSVVFYDRENQLANIEYNLHNTPCELVLKGESVYCSDNVQQCFPKDQDLVDLKAVGYAGQAIYGSDNSIIGHIAIMHDQPIQQPRENIAYLLNLLGIRIGPELERRHSQNLLNELTSDFNLSKETKVFDGMVKKITRTLDVDIAVIGKINKSSSTTTIDVISAGNEQQIFPSFSYELKGSPCEQAVALKYNPLLHQSGLQQSFPDFELFQQLNADSYIGMCLLDRNKEAIGIIGVIHSEPLNKPEPIKDVIGVFAVVAAEELEFLIHTDELEKYKAMSAVSSDCMCLLDKDYHFITANDSYLKLYHLDRKNISNKHYQDIHGEIFFESIRYPALQDCAKDKHITQEFWRALPNGERRYIQSNIIPYYASGKDICGYLLTDIDITREKRQEQLNKIQISLLKIINSSDSLIRTLDYINLEVQNLLGPNILSAVFTTSGDQGEYQLFSCPNLATFKKYTISTSPLSEFASEPIENSSLWQHYLDFINTELLTFHIQMPLFDQENQATGTLSILTTTEKLDSFARHALQVLRHLVNLAIKKDQEDKTLIASKKQFETLYHETPSMFYTINNEHEIVSVNEYGANSLGYIPNDLIGKPIELLIDDEDVGMLSKSFAQQFESDKPLTVEVRKKHRAGHTIYFRLTIKRTVRDGENYLLIVAEDISELHKLSVELNYQATHDMMTGLINRTAFEKRLDTCIQGCKKTNHQHTLCYIDLDQFKVINDSCGHAAGDDLLKNISQIIMSKVRQRDTLARLGGDEFGLLMEHCTLEQAINIAETIRQSVEEYRFEWLQKYFSVSISMGLVGINHTAHSKEEIMRHVDTACYVAKEAGRNRIHVYSDTDEDFQRHIGDMQWVAEINNAFDHDRFRLFSQGIYQIPTGTDQISFHEILIRMVAHDGEIISPGLFLPAAEHFHLSTKIDEWVIETLFKLINQYKIQNQRFFINLSGQSIDQANFHDRTKGLLNAYNIDPSMICFEITETTAIKNQDKAIHFINELKDLGCLFALDDFGSGISSFSYLKTLPVDYVKIDGSFIKNICNDEIDLDMVKSINDIVHKMGKSTIAEFVEQESVLELLGEIQIDYAQGYLLDKPKALHTK